MADKFDMNDILAGIAVDEETLREVELAAKNKRPPKDRDRTEKKPTYSQTRQKTLFKYKVVIAISWVLLAILILIGSIFVFQKLGDIGESYKKVGDGKEVLQFDPVTLFVLEDDAAKSDRFLIMLTRFNIADKKVSVCVLPEQVTMSAGAKSGTLREQFEYGGIFQVKRAVQEFFGITIDKCLDGGFTDFEKILEKIGTIEYNVDRDLKEIAKDGSIYCDLSEGEQSLTAQQIFAFLRYDDWNSLSEKSENCSKLLSQIFQKFWTEDMKMSFDSLFENMVNRVQTDISRADSNALIEQFDNFYECKAQSLPVSVINGAVINTDSKSQISDSFK